MSAWSFRFGVASALQNGLISSTILRRQLWLRRHSQTPNPLRSLFSRKHPIRQTVVFTHTRNNEHRKLSATSIADVVPADARTGKVYRVRHS